MPPRQRHQDPVVRVRRGAGGVLAQGRRRSGALSTPQLQILAWFCSISPFPSARQADLPRHARDHRPQGPHEAVGERAFRGQKGLLGAVVWCGRWALARGKATLCEKGWLPPRVCDPDWECLWTLLNQPTILASIVSPQALIYRSASLARARRTCPPPPRRPSHPSATLARNVGGLRAVSRMWPQSESPPAIYYWNSLCFWIRTVTRRLHLPISVPVGLGGPCSNGLPLGEKHAAPEGN